MGTNVAKDLTPLKIAIIAPPFYAVPPQGFGGVQVHIFHLIKSLRNLGHNISLFASGDSQIVGVEQLHWFDIAAQNVSGKTVPELTHCLAAYKELCSFDIIHDHTFIGPHIGHRFTDTPIVTTLHDIADKDHRLMYDMLDARVGTIAISQHQARGMKPLKVNQTILPGLDSNLYEIGVDAGYVVWLGRFSREKGAETAIAAAKRCNRPIVLAGKIIRGQENYFKNVIEPQFDGKLVKFVGEVGIEEKKELLSNASALINTISYDEPFGLINVEALLSGLPVIAFNRGAFPEIIDHRKNGFLCNTVEEVHLGLNKIDQFDRYEIRHNAVQKFGLDQLANVTDLFYRDWIEKSRMTGYELSSGMFQT